jgi:hypothetical protein
VITAMPAGHYDRSGGRAELASVKAWVLYGRQWKTRSGGLSWDFRLKRSSDQQLFLSAFNYSTSAPE